MAQFTLAKADQTLFKNENLSGLTNLSAARGNLDLGTAAQADTGTATNQVPTGQNLIDQSYVRFTAGAGLQNTNGAAGATTDFPIREGTWTPTSNQVTAAQAEGTYRAHGDVVQIWLTMDGIAVVSGEETTIVNISLPFTVSNSGSSGPGRAVGITSWQDILQGRQLGLFSNTNSVEFSLRDGDVPLTGSDMDTGRFFATGTYIKA